MRFAAAIVIVILCFLERVTAQDGRDTLVRRISGGDLGFSPAEIARMSQDTISMPAVKQGFTKDFNLSGTALPNLNFNLIKGFKIEAGTNMGLRFLSNIRLGQNLKGIYGLPIRDFYQGDYGMRSYEVNNKLYFGTATYNDKPYNEYWPKPGKFPQTNYSSTLFVGYKFSEKFSISAGFSVGSYDGQMYNHR